MNYYILSEQDIYEIMVDIENFIYELKEKIKEKKLNSIDDNVEEEYTDD